MLPRHKWGDVERESMQWKSHFFSGEEGGKTWRTEEHRWRERESSGVDVSLRYSPAPTGEVIGSLLTGMSNHPQIATDEQEDRLTGGH